MDEGNIKVTYCGYKVNVVVETHNTMFINYIDDEGKHIEKWIRKIDPRLRYRENGNHDY